jgi:hypothetical protein
VQPIEYQGRIFRFAHQAQIGGDYSGEKTDSFVFVPTEPT